MINIRQKSAQLLQDRYGIPEMITELLFENNITDDNKMIKILIMHEYQTKVKPGQKQLLRRQLAEKYCLSVSLIEKIVLY